MKKLLFFSAFVLVGALLLRAATPVPYAEGVSFSAKLTGSSVAVVTVYGEGTQSFATDTTQSESEMKVVQLKPGRAYTCNVQFNAFAASTYAVSFIVPSGYRLFVNNTERDLVSAASAGGWSSTDHTIELRPAGTAARADFSSFGGVSLGRSVTWDVGLGSLITGRSAGRVFFKEQDLTSSPASRDRLYYAAPGSDYGEIQVIRDGPSSQRLRQVCVPAGVVDLLDDAAGGYWIRFFLWSQAEGSPGNPYILYGSPWKTIRVESPAANQLKLSETEGSAVRVSLVSAPSIASGNFTWTLQEGGPSNNWLRTTTHTSTLTTPAVATGGTVTTSGGYTIHTFAGSGTFTANQALTVETLLVAGGGAGGGGLINTMNAGGGGGGGVLLNTSLTLSATSYGVTVGAGGASGLNGGNTTFAGLTAVGGGHGAHSAYAAPGAAGGSGGGEGTSQGGGAGAGTSGQGTNGAAGAGAPYYAGGGGGGATSAGSGINGGNGYGSSISGSLVYYGGGGGAGSNDSAGGAGGQGGGANGGGSSTYQGGNGAANTGGGGGGSSQWTSTGGAGGSGVVIVRYNATGASYREVVAEVRTGGTGGTLVAKSKFRYENPGGWGEELVKTWAYPTSSTLDASALATTYAYYTDANAKGNYRRVKSVTGPTGAWTAWAYYDDWDKRGQLQYEYRPFLDAPATVTLNPASGRVASHSYAADWTGRHARLTLREERVNNVLTAKTTLSHSDTVGSGWPRETATANLHRDAANTHTEITESYRADAGYNEPGLPYVTRHADQRQTSFSYAHGDWNGTTFTVGASPYYRRHLSVHGSTSSAGATSVSSWNSQNFAAVYLVANKSTLEAAILNQKGQVIRVENYVWDGSTFALLTHEAFTYDNQGRLTQKTASNGATTDYAYVNGRLDTATDAAGTVTKLEYDALGRVLWSRKNGASALASALTSGYSYPQQSDLYTHYVYDGANRVRETVVTAATTKPGSPGGANDLFSFADFDLAGRPTSTTAPGGYVTSFTYANGGRTTTTTLPGTSATKITDTYLDGQVKSVTGTAVVNEWFAPAVATDGTRELVHRQVSSTGPIVETVYADWLGRQKQRLVASPSGTGHIDESSFYNSAGQLWKTTRTGVNPTLHVYDTLGALIRTGLDVNNNGALDLASTDRVTEKAYTYFTTGGNWWRRDTTTTYATDNSSTATTLGKTETQLNGLPANRLARADTTDIFGNVTSTTTDVDRANKKIVTTTDTPDSTTNTIAVAHNGLSVEAQDFAGIRFRAEYDALGRPWKSIDPRTGTTTTTYVSGTSLVSTITDPASVVTATYAYDSAGRVSSIKDALNKYAYTTYTNRGELYRTWGDTAYPVEYTYDDQGRRSTMKTYRSTTANFAASTWPTSPGTADTTTWAYHANTGLLSYKEDAVGKRVNYTYNAAGQLASREWARLLSGSTRVTTTYGYSSTTGERLTVDYNDSTPDLTYTYNRMGQPATVADATGTRTFTYNLSATLELQSETLGTSGSAFYGDRKVNRLYDTTGTGTKGRYTGVTVTNAGVIDGYNLNFGYEATGRLNTVYTTTYTYTANSHLVQGVTNSSWNYDWQRAYHSARDVVATSTTTGAGGSVKSAFSYTRDKLYRAITVAKTGEVFNAHGNGTQGLETDYAYNDRSELTADSTTLGGSTTPLSGRDDYHAYDPIGNRTQVLRSGATVNYTANNLNQYTAFTGSSTHTYDDDGNLTNDGVWIYAWDAENRLITQDSIAHVRKLEFKYDYMGRRVQKTVREGWNGSAYTTVPTERKFLYDGHELIQEFTGSLGHVSNYVWGLGLDASRSGAGGVGGLLFIYDYATGHVLQPGYDAMGNVSGLVRSDGTLVAKYEYDAFGQTIATSGTYAAANPFRFATKYTDSETGHVNFGYRLYSPSLARFISRDSIGEEGGLNLYAYCANDAANHWDYLGMYDGIRDLWDSRPLIQQVTNPQATPQIPLTFTVSRTAPGLSATVFGVTIGGEHENSNFRPSSRSMTTIAGNSIYTDGIAYNSKDSVYVSYSLARVDVVSIYSSSYTGVSSARDGGYWQSDTSFNKADFFTKVGLDLSKGKGAEVGSSAAYDLEKSEWNFTVFSLTTPWGGFQIGLENKGDKQGSSKDKSKPSAAASSDEEVVKLAPVVATQTRTRQQIDAVADAKARNPGWQNASIFQMGKMSMGDRLLVYGAASISSPYYENGTIGDAAAAMGGFSAQGVADAKKRGQQ